jgi:hypothetical protein
MRKSQLDTSYDVSGQNADIWCCCSDRKWMKWMVVCVLVIDTLNSAVSAYTAYDYAVADFGTPIDLFSHSKFETFVLTVLT